MPPTKKKNNLPRARTTGVAKSDIKAISSRAKTVLKSRYPSYLADVVEWVAPISTMICAGRLYVLYSGYPTTDWFLIWGFRIILPLSVADALWLAILVWKETSPERQIRASKQQPLLNLWIGIFCFHSVCFFEDLIRPKKGSEMITALLNLKPTLKKLRKSQLFGPFTPRASRDIWAAEACKNGIIPNREQAWLSIRLLNNAE